MQLSQQECQIIKICVEELESTLGHMPAKEADSKVLVVAKILKVLIVDKEGISNG